MTRRFVPSLILACTAACASVAHGETSARRDSVYFVPEVNVDAPRPLTTVGGAAAVEAQVESLAVPAAATVEEVLRELPLLHVRTNSRGEAELSARGSESRQVAVLVDGIPITLAWDARADVSVLPSSAIQDVRFVRGLSSMLYGPNVLGGIVLTRIGQTSHQPSARSASLTLGTDDVGSFGTTASVALPFERDSGDWLVRGGLGFRDTAGDPLARDVHEPIASDRALRQNTDARNVDGFAAFRYQSDAGAWFAFSGSSFREERGIAAELGVADEDARLWRYPHVSRTLTVLSGGTGFHASPFGGAGDLEASLGLDRGRTEIDAYTTRRYDERDGFERGRDQTSSFRLLADQTLGPRGDLRAAFTLADIHHDEAVPEGTYEYQQRLWSAGLEHGWRVLESRGRLEALSVSAGTAYDVGATPKSGGREPLGRRDEWGGRLGLTAVFSGGRAVLHAGRSQRGRFPALRELYSGSLNRFAPSPDLEPETLVTSEAGVTARSGRGELQAVFFRNQLRDAVVRITLPDRRFQRVNRDELRSTGLELVASTKLGAVDLSGSATLQSVEWTDTSVEETHRPENLPEAFGKFSARVPVTRGVVGSAELEITGDQFSIDPATGEDARLDAVVIVNASLSRRWRAGMSWGGGRFSSFETRLALDNVGDDARFDSSGLPEPGRRVRFEVRVR